MHSAYEIQGDQKCQPVYYCNNFAYTADHFHIFGTYTHIYTIGLYI